MIKQKTLKKPVQVKGIGVHSGEDVTLTIGPAPAHTGFMFRLRLPSGESSIPGRWDCVTDTHFCTQLSNAEGESIGTVEHLMAAFAACEIDNAEVLVEGAREIPILDGSAKLFIEALEQGGIQTLEAPRHFIYLTEALEIREEKRFVRLEPLSSFERKGAYPTPTFDFSFDFSGGRQGMAPQSYHFAWNPQAFREDLSGARTFGFFEDGQKLQAMGLAKGASLENTVVIHEGRVMNEGGLRYPDEFVRHKILDAVGDLALAGASLVGAYHSHNGGHELNNRLLRKLFATPKAWESSKAA